MAGLIDLRALSAQTGPVTADVCVIGAGAAGLYLAHRLASRGLHVVIIEAGAATCREGATVGIDAVQCGAPYGGAAGGRAFGLGGSTSRWGGLLVPHSDVDLRDDGSVESLTWKHIVGVVRDRTASVTRVLGLGSRPDFFSFADESLGETAAVLRSNGLTTIASEFLPWRLRNLAYLASSHTSGSIRTYVNAIATTWSCVFGAGGGAIRSVEARSLSGNRLRIDAGVFVIAAGALESARILLEINRQAGDRLLAERMRTGTCLSDHLSYPLAQVEPGARHAAAMLFSPVFSRGRMRSFRFVVAATGAARPRHFAHFIFENDNPGFLLAKEVLSSLQVRRAPRLSVSQAAAGMNGLMRLAYARFAKSRLLPPRGAPCRLQLDIEQVPSPTNRVALGSGTDRTGRPEAIIHWALTKADDERYDAVSKELLARWPGHMLGFPKLLRAETAESVPKPHDAYHPVGTCRMGTDEEATVDNDLRVHGTSNLFVLSTGVFPSAGTANPTFSMLCLGDRLSDHLSAAARSKSA